MASWLGIHPPLFSLLQKLNLSSRERISHLKNAYADKGLQGVAECLKHMLSHWKKTSFKIAVAGRSGTGKSTFINAIRGISADDLDKDPAPVGVTEMTFEIRGYKYPGNENLIIFDLQGLGTPTFNRENYLSKIGVDDYDFFILMLKERFYGDDLWLAQKLFDANKKFYFVHSNIHAEIKNDKKAHPKTHDAAKAVESIRRNITINVEKTEFKGFKVYLIDSHKTQLYDFGALTKAFMEESTDELKREVLAFSFQRLSKEIIEEKKTRLANRIPFNCLYYCLPGLSMKADEVIEFYKEQFGVDAKSIQGLKLSQNFLSLTDGKENDSDHKNQQTMASIGSGYYVSSYLLPIIGNIALACRLHTAYTTILEKTANYALQIHLCLSEDI